MFDCQVEVGLLTILVWSAVLGCTRGRGAFEAELSFDTLIPSVARVALPASEGDAWVEFGLAGVLDQRVDAVPVEGGLEARLVGLKAGRRYGWRPVLVEPDGHRINGVLRFFDTPALPEALPPFEVTVRDPNRSEADDGWLLMNVHDQEDSFVVVVDGDGDVVWWVPDDGPPYRINRARWGLDGASINRSQYDDDRVQDVAVIDRFALDGSSRVTTQVAEQHHDFVEHPDGTFAWLSWGFVEEPLLGFGEGVTAYDIVRQAPEGAVRDEGVARFDLVDQYPDDMSWSCMHQGEGQFVPGAFEWSHSNSIVHDPARDRWYVHARYLDALLAIDRPTGRLEWVLGGDASEFELVGDGLPEIHGHLSDVTDGSLMVFDNQDHGTGISRAVEYAFDEQARTYEQVWSYEDPEGRFTSFLGDARRLPGGHRLVTWSPHGEIEEVTWEGDVVWALRHDFVIGRVTPSARGAISRSARP